ncbi:MAG: hypothetical protein Kow0074_10620 [Candidatus Zixiibacteriota bacterium]
MTMRAWTFHQINQGIAALATGLTVWLLPQVAEPGTLKLNSAWSNGTVSVDGHDADWEAGRTYLDARKMTVGVQNDSQYVFVCLVTTDETIVRQILAAGLTVWFDPDGGDDKRFGIRYPLTRRGMGLPPPSDARRPDPHSVDLSDSVAPEMELLDEQGEIVQRLRTGARSDLTAQIRLADNRLVYELQVPLYFGASHPFAIGTAAGAHVGVGFETPEMTRDRPSMNEPRGGMGRSGGRMGGGGFGGRGGAGRGSNRNRPGRPEPLKLWTQIYLAESPATSQVYVR